MYTWNLSNSSKSGCSKILENDHVWPSTSVTSLITFHAIKSKIIRSYFSECSEVCSVFIHVHCTFNILCSRFFLKLIDNKFEIGLLLGIVWCFDIVGSPWTVQCWETSTIGSEWAAQCSPADFLSQSVHFPPHQHSANQIIYTGSSSAKVAV